MKGYTRQYNRPNVKIIPLGGLEQIGMNITAIEYQNQIIVVDCGQAFPSEDMPGVDMVIPDVTYLRENKHKVRAFFITHGHEDHIGALPYILQEINVPIYATKLTMALIQLKLQEHNLLNKVRCKVVKVGSTVNLRDFHVEFIRSTHSIQDSVMLAIGTPVGTILHTGDFKVDYTPINGQPMDFTRLAEIGKRGVLAMLCDSTNVLKPGYTMSERAVGKTFDNIFIENRRKRIIVATFASNIDRVQQVIDMAYKYNRKVFVEGRSMVNIINVASELKYLNVYKNIIESTENMKNYPDDKIVVLTTGSQGEAMAALSRIAANIHKHINIKHGDVVVFSSTPIPGNEKSVTKVINELALKGAKVIVEDTHVSGHACQEEIKLIYSLVKPKFAVPVHGEFRHLIGHADLVKSLGYSNDEVFIMKTGQVLSLTRESGKIIGNVQVGNVYVDGLGVGDVGDIVIRDRQSMGEAGILVTTIVVDRYNRRIIDQPYIVSKGFVFVQESENLINEAKQLAYNIVERNLKKVRINWTRTKLDVKSELEYLMKKRTGRKPVILTIIMEV